MFSNLSFKIPNLCLTLASIVIDDHSKAIICKPSELTPVVYSAKRFTCLEDSLFQNPATNHPASQPPSHSNTIPLLRFLEAHEQWAVPWWSKTASVWWAVGYLFFSSHWISTKSQSEGFASKQSRWVVSWLKLVWQPGSKDWKDRWFLFAWG